MPLPTRLTDWLDTRRAALAQKAANALRDQVEQAENRVSDAIHHHLWDFQRSLASEQCLEALRRARREEGPQGVVEAVREIREVFYRDVCARAKLEVMRQGLHSRFEPSAAEKARHAAHADLVGSLLGQWRHVAAANGSTNERRTDVAAVLELVTAAPVERPTRAPVTAAAVARVLEAPTLNLVDKAAWEQWVRDGTAFGDAFARAVKAPGEWVQHAALLGPEAQDVLEKAGLRPRAAAAPAPPFGR